ncbi:50S ribosomal protein L9, partial [Vibrionales bacterium SWAT-3]
MAEQTAMEIRIGTTGLWREPSLLYLALQEPYRG